MQSLPGDMDDAGRCSEAQQRVAAVRNAPAACGWLALGGFGACGIKPGSVAAPQGEEKDNFPAEYPNPSTFSRPDAR